MYIYKDVWSASVGAVLQGEREARNMKDPHAVAVKKDGLIVGHVLRIISSFAPCFYGKVAQ